MTELLGVGRLPIRTRRDVLGLVGAGAVLTMVPSVIRTASAASDDDETKLTEASVLRDPDVPVTGNPGGDIAIVEWSDYQCPYCRKIEPDLRQVVNEDGKLRLVMKDWPILGPVSVTAARMALASKYQDKHQAAHDALMGNHSRLTGPRIDELIAGAGIDMDRLRRDLSARGSQIDAILARNNAQATAFGFQGTPSFIVGHFRVPGVLTIEQFKLAIADARKATKL